MEDRMASIKSDLDRLNDVDFFGLNSLEVTRFSKEEKASIRKAKAIITRKTKKLYKKEKKIVDSCEHDYQWVCSGHNDDGYECTKCGALEWR